MTQTTDQETNFGVVGKPTLRKDATDKLTGHTRFVGDMKFYGMLHARLVLSPYAHARIVSIDTSAAEALPGVRAVYTAETLKMAGAGSTSRVQSPLAKDEVFWCGHPVAIVLGETESAAEDGVALVDIDYEPLPVVIDTLSAMKADSPLTRPRNEDESSEIAGGGAHADVGGGGEVEEEETEELSSNVSDKMHMRVGDIDAGLKEADVVVEHTYRTHTVHQSYIEPQSITVVPDAYNRQFTVYASSQTLFGVRSDIAKALNIAEKQIHVESVPIGGAFGGKFGLIEPLVAAAAYAAGSPVSLVYTRQEDLLAGNPAPQSYMTVKLGAKKDGTLVALQARIVLDTGTYAGAAAGLAAHLMSSVYRCPNVDIRGYEVLTNKVSVGAYRAPDAPQAAFALESTVTKLCEAMEFDPLELRKINALRGGDPSGDPRRPELPPLGLVECLEEVQKHPLWQRRFEKEELTGELAGWKIGYGLAAGGWPGGTDPAAAACRLESDGTISVVLGTVDISGSDTSLAIIAAEAIGLSSSVVDVVHDNTDTMPYSSGTGGSKTIYSMGPAVIAAARDARAQIFNVASDLLEASAEDLEIKDGDVAVKGVPGRSVSLKEVSRASKNFQSRFGPVYGRGSASVTESSPMYTAHLAKVAVDPETGNVRVLDYLVAQDIGRAINPAAVEGQIHGGVTQGLGWALLEGFEYDENGQLLTSTLMDYALPHSFDVPNIESILVEIPSGLGPYGAKGVGEPPVVPVAGAVSNAIKDAIGIRVAEIPMTPERIFKAIQEQA